MQKKFLLLLAAVFAFSALEGCGGDLVTSQDGCSYAVILPVCSGA